MKLFGNKKEAKNGYVVQIKDVVKSFPVGDSEVKILKGISFEVKDGEFVSIVGPSGNGKSTLLNLITGIDHPTGGEAGRIGVLGTNKRLFDLPRPYDLY